MIDARSCNEIRSLMADWLDSELSPALRSRVDEHLAACDSCRTAFDQMRAMGGDLTSLGLAGDRIAESAAHYGRSIPTWRRAWVRAAAIAIIVAGGIYVASTRHGERGSDAVVERMAENANNGPDRDAVAVMPGGTCQVSGHTAVAMATSNPRVRIVWLYEDTSVSDGSTNSSGGVQPRPRG